jgi:carboxylesterase
MVRRLPAGCSWVAFASTFLLMKSDRPGATAPDVSHSRFGESRFGNSRFGPGLAGAWVEEGPKDAHGRAAGWYRAGTDDGPVTGLTVLRPAPKPTSTPSPQAPAKPPKSTAPRTLNLPGGRHGVLLFHGLSSTPLELQFLARGLHRAGYTVRIAVIDGYSHGLPTSGPNGHAHWAHAAVAEFDRMRAQCDSLAVGGLCIGALLSLHVAAERSAGVSHVLALSTTLRYDGWAAPWTRWMLPLARVLPWAGRIAVKEREPYGLKDERLRAWIAGQMKESGGSDAGASVLRVGDLVEAQNLMRRVRKGLRRITAPTLLIHAKDDDCASPRSADDVASGVSSTRVHRVILYESYHMISIDKEKARVLAEMKEFLQAEPQNADASVIAPVQSVQSDTLRSSEHVRA